MVETHARHGDSAVAAAEYNVKAVAAGYPASYQAAKHCTQARTGMTPCVIRDGKLAQDDRGCCVGCGMTNR